MEQLLNTEKLIPNINTDLNDEELNKLNPADKNKYKANEKWSPLSIGIWYLFLFQAYLFIIIFYKACAVGKKNIIGQLFKKDQGPEIWNYNADVKKSLYYGKKVFKVFFYFYFF